MSAHSFFSPSSAHRWINCPGSMAFNQQDSGSNTHADSGTASHELSARALITDMDCAMWIGESITVNNKEYAIDEERASFCQVYVDDVRRRAIGGHLFVEQKIDISDYLGEGQGGTGDACIYLPSAKRAIIEDLKYGTGEKVFAKDNPQLMLYALGLLKDFAMFGEIETVLLVICQPRLGHIDEHEISVADLKEFGVKADYAVMHARHAMKLPPDSKERDLYITPGEKQCRWCRHKPHCAKLAKVVSEEVMADFDNIAEEPPAVAVSNLDRLARMFAAVPLVEQWCRAVKEETFRLVAQGTQVMGPDGKPLKFVEGAEGKRAWDKDKLKDVEALLVGQLGPKAYAEPTLITAPAAGKLLDKKKTAATWEVFKPFIKRAAGRPVLTIGSDPRPPFSGAATSDDFDEIGAE